MVTFSGLHNAKIQVLTITNSSFYKLSANMRKQRASRTVNPTFTFDLKNAVSSIPHMTFATLCLMLSIKYPFSFCVSLGVFVVVVVVFEVVHPVFGRRIAYVTIYNSPVSWTQATLHLGGLT